INKNPVTQSFSPDTEAIQGGVGVDSRKIGIRPAIPNTNNMAFVDPGDDPTSFAFSTANFRSDHNGGANFLFADGSVHFLGEDIDMQTYQKLSTIGGDDPVTIP